MDYFREMIMSERHSLTTLDIVRNCFDNKIVPFAKVPKRSNAIKAYLHSFDDANPSPELSQFQKQLSLNLLTKPKFQIFLLTQTKRKGPKDNRPIQRKSRVYSCPCCGKNTGNHTCEHDLCPKPCEKELQRSKNEQSSSFEVQHSFRTRKIGSSSKRKSIKPRKSKQQIQESSQFNSQLIQDDEESQDLALSSSKLDSESMASKKLSISKKKRKLNEGEKLRQKDKDKPKEKQKSKDKILPESKKDAKTYEKIEQVNQQTTKKDKNQQRQQVQIQQESAKEEVPSKEYQLKPTKANDERFQEDSEEEYSQSLEESIQQESKSKMSLYQKQKQSSPFVIAEKRQEQDAGQKQLLESLQKLQKKSRPKSQDQPIQGSEDQHQSDDKNKIVILSSQHPHDNPQLGLQIQKTSSRPMISAIEQARDPHQGNNNSVELRPLKEENQPKQQQQNLHIFNSQQDGSVSSEDLFA